VPFVCIGRLCTLPRYGITQEQSLTYCRSMQPTCSVSDKKQKVVQTPVSVLHGAVRYETGQCTHAHAHTRAQEFILLMAVGELTNEFVGSLYPACIIHVYSVQLN
jgi:hypothetical protein